MPDRPAYGPPRARLRARLLAAAAGFALAGGGLPRTLRAQPPWPARPVKLVVAYPPGGAADLIARLLAPLLGAALGQPFVVENRAGASGMLGAASVASAAPDGYTVLVSSATVLGVAPAMQERPPFDPVDSFVHVVPVGIVPTVFLVHPAVPVHTLAELQVWLKLQPDPVLYGSGGVGSVGRVVAESWARLTGARLEHVAYRGSGPMRMALQAGTIGIAVDTLPPNIGEVLSGRLRALAVTSPERLRLLPEVPTTAELGMPALTTENFIGLAVPAGTPSSIVAALHGAVSAATQRPDLSAALEAAAILPCRMSQPEFAALVKRQVRDWALRVKAANLRMQ
jgi:tripartite-type tricarboxylate transporter receptor subunit TctC